MPDTFNKPTTTRLTRSLVPSVKLCTDSPRMLRASAAFAAPCQDVPTVVSSKIVASNHSALPAWHTRCAQRLTIACGLDVHTAGRPCCVQTAS